MYWSKVVKNVVLFVVFILYHFFYTVGIITNFTWLILFVYVFL